MFAILRKIVNKLPVKNRAHSHFLIFKKIKVSLTHLHQVDSSTITLWIGLFPVVVCLVSLILLIYVL